MTKAVSVLRPAAECLKSKPLLRVLRNAAAGLERCAPLIEELSGVKATIVQVDQMAVAEERRLIGLWQAEPQREIGTDEVIVPEGYAAYLERVEAFNASVAEAFENLDLSLEDIGTAGSPALKAYEKLMELCPSWEDDLQIPEPFHAVDGLAESILDSASMNVPEAEHGPTGST
jgi:hypothetical protein